MPRCEGVLIMENAQWRIENVPLHVRSFCILHSAFLPPRCEGVLIMENAQWRIENVPLHVRSFCILHSALCIPPAPLRRRAPQNSGCTTPTGQVGAFFAPMCASVGGMCPPPLPGCGALFAHTYGFLVLNGAAPAACPRLPATRTAVPVVLQHILVVSRARDMGLV
jgi:hypothetical protein